MRKKPTQRIFLLRPWFIGMLCTIVLASWFTFGESGVWASRKLRRQKAIQIEEIRRLEEHKAALQKYLADLRAGDERALERAARDKGFVAPNETIFDVRVEPVKNKLK